MNTNPILKSIVQTALDIKTLLSESDVAQWQRSHSPQPYDDTTERSRGGHSDPTADIVSDPRRLELREAVQAAEKALGDADLALRKAKDTLDVALDKWAGA